MKKSDREGQISFDITYLWNLENHTNELNYRKEKDSQTENKLWLPKGKDGAGEINYNFEINIYTLLYMYRSYV